MNIPPALIYLRYLFVEKFDRARFSNEKMIAQTVMRKSDGLR